MDNDNWRPTQQGGEPAMDADDWRSKMHPISRHRIVNKIMETLKKHLPFSGQDGLLELQKIAERFEEKIFSAAVNQPDYLRKISLKMLTMEGKSQNGIASGGSSKPPDPGIHGMPSQVPNKVQLPLPTNQPQALQQLLSHAMQNNSVPQSSAGLPSALPPVSGIPQNPIPNVSSQGSNIQNISGVSQNPVGNSMGPGGLASNVISNTQRQLTARQQIIPQQQQQQQQPQNPPQYLYQQQVKQKLQQQQQQQQHNMLESTQLHSSQQSAMPAPMMQSAGLQHNQQSSVQQKIQTMLQQHPQSTLRQPPQASVLHQQQTPIQQQQQQQQLMGQPPSATSIQQNQLIGKQNHVVDMQQQQQQQQQQRVINQQNNIPNLQQKQQHLMAQQGNMANMHQQQMGPQTNVSGLHQQPQLIGIQSNSGSQINQHPMNMMQQSKIQLQPQTQQSAPNPLPTQGQEQQPHPSQPQQLMSHIQSQPGQLQQYLLQQQPNSLQRDMQQRVQASGSLLQPQNVHDQQKQLYQSQRPIPESSSTSMESTSQMGDWQEDIYQRIKLMKEMYFPDLNDMSQKVSLKLQQQGALQQARSEQLEKLKMFKSMLERMMSFLQMTKSSILPSYKEKIDSYEKQIINIINTNRPRKPLPSLQQGQLPPSHMHSMQQPQSQMSQLQSHENQINPQLQSMNLQSTVGTIQQNNMTNLQHSTISSLSGVSTAQQNIMNSVHRGSNFDSGQGNALRSLQQVSVQQNSVSQQANINHFSSQSGVLQNNANSLHSNTEMLQQQNLKHQEQQMLQTQQLKQQYQLQQHQQQQQQFMQKQQIMQQQQLLQQAKLPSQLQANQMSQLQQMNDVNDMKVRQGMNVKQGVLQQHPAVGQRAAAYSHQQLKSGPPYPISSPQLFQDGSPQIPQHSSPQIDQQNMLSSLSKDGTPFQSANSPFVVPSPPTPLAPSPMPGDTEKPSVPVMSTLSNTGSIGHQRLTTTASAPSLAIGTPGISASPLLEVTGSDGTHGNAFLNTCAKSSVMEQPLERLVKAVKLLSPKALSSSVSDIGSVVTMIDRVAGSAPGNGSRAAVGEDLVCMTKSRLQTRNFITQDGTTGSKKIRRYTSAMPLNVVSSAGSINNSFKWLTGPGTSDLESTATSGVKRLKIELMQANHNLLEEIREINQRLIDTVVNISDEDVDPTAVAVAVAEGGEGTIVKCSFNGVAFSPNLQSQFASAQLSPIQPLQLLIPTNYPNCSPVLLDKLPVEVGKGYEDLSMKAKSRFSVSLRTISQPMSLGEIARTWDVCARAVISEYAHQSGGGSFSSKYGSWESCLSAT